eukprot:3086497-Heterocapsa_arctica.AAC.1
MDGCLRRPCEAAYLIMAKLSPTILAVRGTEQLRSRRATASRKPWDSAMGPHFSPGSETEDTARGFLFP